MESKILNSYKGFSIEKSYDLDTYGRIDKETVVYSAYDKEGDLFDSNTDLDILKRLITSYILDKRLH